MPSNPLNLDLFPLGSVLFPFQSIPLQIFEPRYLTLMRECREAGKVFGICLIEEGSEVGAPAIPCKTGTAASIEAFQEAREGLVLLVARGGRRFRISRILQEQPHIRVSVEWLDDATPTFSGDYAALRGALERLVDRGPGRDELRAAIELATPHELLGLTGGLLAGQDPLARQQVLEQPADQIVSSLTRIVDALTNA